MCMVGIQSGRMTTNASSTFSFPNFFKPFDRLQHGTGLVSRRDFSKTAKRLGFRFTKEEIDGLFAFLDKNGDGSLSLSEFRSFAKIDGEGIAGIRERLRRGMLKRWMEKGAGESKPRGGGTVPPSSSPLVLPSSLPSFPLRSSPVLTSSLKTNALYSSSLFFFLLLLLHVCPHACATDFFSTFSKIAGGKRAISLAQLERALRKMGFDLAQEDVEQVFVSFDGNHDGRIDYRDFCDAIIYEVDPLVRRRRMREGGREGERHDTQMGKTANRP